MKLYRSNTVDKNSYEANYNSWFAGLPVDVQAVVWDYTESGYKSLNAWLRGEISDLTGALSHKAQTLEAALTASAGFQGPTTLLKPYRSFQRLVAASNLMLSRQPRQTLTRCSSLLTSHHPSSLKLQQTRLRKFLIYMMSLSFFYPKAQSLR
jgi:hypothetical protein